MPFKKMPLEQDVEDRHQSRVAAILQKPNTEEGRKFMLAREEERANREMMAVVSAPARKR